MPYADRATQLQYLKDRRKRLRVGRKVNASPYAKMETDGSEIKMRQLAPPLVIKPQKPPPTPYNRNTSIEKEVKLSPEPYDLNPTNYADRFIFV